MTTLMMEDMETPLPDLEDRLRREMAELKLRQRQVASYRQDRRWVNWRQNAKAIYDLLLMPSRRIVNATKREIERRKARDGL